MRGRTKPAVTLQCAHGSAPSLRPECTHPQVPAEPFTQRAAHLCQQRGTPHLPAVAPITLDNSTHLMDCSPSHEPASVEQVGTRGNSDETHRHFCSQG